MSMKYEGVETAPTRLESLASAVARTLPDQLHPVPNTCRELTYEVAAGALLRVAAVLRDPPQLKFEKCADVCGGGYLEHGRAEWQTQDATSLGCLRGGSPGAENDGPPAHARR